MKNLFDNETASVELFSKLESIFDLYSGQTLLEKVAELYLVYLEDFGLESNIDEIVEFADDCGHDLTNLKMEIDRII